MRDTEFLKQQIESAQIEREILHRWRPKMQWKYNQETGHLYDPDGAMVAIGYAGGDGGKRPDGVNSHALQNVPNVGPLPCGIYTFGEPVEHSQLGPFAIPLIPDPGNEMFGRSGLYCHGDTFAMNHSASDGCMIMPHQIRTDMWESEVHTLLVYVEGE